MPETYRNIGKGLQRHAGHHQYDADSGHEWLPGVVHEDPYHDQKDAAQPMHCILGRMPTLQSHGLQLDIGRNSAGGLLEEITLKFLFLP
jgi:hypothetical protein